MGFLRFFRSLFNKTPESKPAPPLIKPRPPAPPPPSPATVAQQPTSPPPAARPSPTPSRTKTVVRAGTLTAVVGAVAAGILFTTVPEDESGRHVDVEIAEDGTATVTHVRGRQYLEVYIDLAGVPTVCDGITTYKGGPLPRNHTFTEEECTAMLEYELVKHASGVMRCTPSFDPDTDGYQIAAAVSLAYNVGVGAWCGSSARRNFEANNPVQACNRFMPWNKARVNGVLRPVRGLTNRRNREREICITGLVSGATPENMWERVARWK